MDFVSGLPRSLIEGARFSLGVDRLTKSAHFLPFKTGTTLEKLAEMYLFEV